MNCYLIDGIFGDVQLLDQIPRQPDFIRRVRIIDFDRDVMPLPAKAYISELSGAETGRRRLPGVDDQFGIQPRMGLNRQNVVQRPHLRRSI
jgi:hypothetical protein